MLALRVLDMKVVSFTPHQTLKNYSWFEQHHCRAVPFNVSVVCFKDRVLQAVSECLNAKVTASVYVCQQSYKFAPVNLTKGLCLWCQPTSDRILLGLRHVQEHMRGARADQHDSSPGLVRYSLRQLSPHLQMMQLNTWDPFGECPRKCCTVCWCRED
jgi:hypothetical protein